MTKMAKSNINMAATVNHSDKYISELQKSLATLISACESLASQQAMPDEFWMEQVDTARRLLNLHVQNKKVPSEVFVELDDDGTPIWVTTNKSNGLAGIEQYRYLLDNNSAKKATR
jgi:hypothetical protein